MTLKEMDATYIANTYKRFPIELVSGQGSHVTDADGKDYIDMGSGIAVNSFGVNDETWKNAVIEQLGKLQHTSNLYYSEPCVKLAKMLCERTGMKKVFFSNSGAEANECAIKVARKYASDKHGADTFTIVTLVNSFHGRTISTLSATGQEHYHELFQPLTPGFKHINAGSIEELDELSKTTKIAAVMIECVQGEGGVLPLSKDFVKGVREWTQDNGALMIVDEVQTGNGRSGALYSYMNFGVMPDIVSTAKGLAGGIPIGATLLGEKVKDVLGYGDHGSTFGANLIACAGAVSIVERLDDDFLSEVREKSAYIVNELGGQGDLYETGTVTSTVSGIESISGMGLMLGIKTVKPAGEVVAKCQEKGVLCLIAKDKVRLLPPLNIPMEDLKKAVEVIKECCKAY